MLKFTKGQSETFVLTLTEKVTLTTPNYLFVFKSRESEREVKFVLLNSSNAGYTDRFDMFTISVDDYFINENAGLFSYKVYEQASNTNTDPAGLNCIETGLLKLLPASDAAQLQYAGESTTYKVYNAGQ